MSSFDLAILDRLAQFPLFLGMSKRELTEIVGQTRFTFARHAAGDIIAAEGTPCESLSLLLAGTVVLTRHADDRSYHVEERLVAPTLLYAEHLFGLIRRHGGTYQSLVRCETLDISKAETLRLLATYDIFRLHLLNLLSTRVQRLSHRPLRVAARTIGDKICRLLSDHCLYPAGEKVFHLTMQQLSSSIGESRLNVSRALHGFESDGLLELGRGTIHVAALERLFQDRRHK